MNHKQSAPGYAIDTKLRDDLLAYLATRPWQEVNALIVAMVSPKQATASHSEPRPSGSGRASDSP